MSDPRLVDQQRDLAESLLASVMKMDEGSLLSRGFSVESSIGNIGIDHISDLYLEHWLELQDMQLTVLKHIRDYPNGFFVALLESVVNQWTHVKGYDRNKIRKDFMLIE